MSDKSTSLGFVNIYITVIHILTIKIMFEIIEIELGIRVLAENDKNVFTSDCQRFRISKEDKKLIYQLLLTIAETIQEGGSLDPHIKKGILKKLERQPKALAHNLWEVRDEGRGTRLIFTIQHPYSIIVSAVSKNKGSLNQAVNRGANRWIKYLKQKKE